MYSTTTSLTLFFFTKVQTIITSEMKVAMIIVVHMMMLLFQFTQSYIIPSILWSNRHGKDLTLLFNHRILAGNSHGFPSQQHFSRSKATHCSRIYSEISGKTNIYDYFAIFSFIRYRPCFKL